jgi:hypothetical protein
MKSVIFFFVLSMASFAQQNYDDVVYLKNGSVIRGVIIEQVPNVSLKLQTKDGNIFVYKMEEVEKMTKEQAQGYNQQSEDYAGSEKSPGLAFALSFIIPGLGQYYNGDYVKGAVMDVLWVSGWVMYFTAGYEDVYYYGYYYSYYEEEATTWLYVGLGLALGTSIWSMIDAPICASNYNDNLRNQKQRYGHMYENYLNDRVVLGIDLSPTLKGFAGGITLHF